MGRVRIIFPKTNPMKNKTRPLCKQDQLVETIQKFSFLLKGWEKGDQCFLSLNEVGFLHSYDEAVNEKISATKLNLSTSEFKKRRQYVILKLQFNHRQFKLWESGRIVNIVPYPPFDTFDKFLSVPLSEHNLHTRFYNMLRAMDCKTINDVLKFSVNDLMRLSGVGKKSIEELEKLLTKNDCLQLLIY